MLNLGSLSFAAGNNLNISHVNEVVAFCKQQSMLFNQVYYKTYASEDLALAEADREALASKNVWALVVFDTLDMTTGDFSYTIRMNYTATPSTRSIVSKLARGLQTGYRKYYTSGFLSLNMLLQDYQSFVFGNIMAGSHNIPTNLTIGVTGVPFPTAGFANNDFYSKAAGLMGFIICLAVTLPVIRMIKGMVEEKEETKMKETLKIMGLQSFPYLASWVSLYLIIYTIICVLSVALLKLTMFNKSNVVLLLVVFGMFYLTLIAICYIFASVLNK